MLERRFGLKAQGTDVRTEVLGGATTFMTMAYIVVVNPAVLSQAGLDFGAVMTATCLSAALATWVMGFAANYPIAMAPAMGENFFFLSVVVGMGVAWPTALAAVFVSGVAFFLLTFLGIREKLIDAVPASLKHAIAAGIGLFVAFIGLVNAGLVERPAGGGILHLGNLARPPVLVAILGLLVTAVLLARKVRGAILLGMLAAGGREALGDGPIAQVAWRAALASPAIGAFAPAQDLLGLGSEARLNTPGTATGNWTWRLGAGQLEALEADAATLRKAIGESGRLAGNPRSS